MTFDLILAPVQQPRQTSAAAQQLQVGVVGQLLFVAKRVLILFHTHLDFGPWSKTAFRETAEVEVDVMGTSLAIRNRGPAVSPAMHAKNNYHAC